MATVLCVLYDDPVDGYPPSYARDEVPVIERYPDGQSAPTPEALGFTPGAILGMILGEAVAISIGGGLIGYAISTLLLGMLLKTPFAGFLGGLHPVELSVALVCVATAGFIGLMSSLLPAMSASRTSIVQALRSTD